MENKFDISEFTNTLTEQKVLCDLVNRVKERRKELKITQQKLAIRSGVSYGSIRRFEASGEISFTSLLKIANALNALEEFTLLFSRENITNLKDY